MYDSRLVWPASLMMVVRPCALLLCRGGRAQLAFAHVRHGWSFGNVPPPAPDHTAQRFIALRREVTITHCASVLTGNALRCQQLLWLIPTNPEIS
eukprot:SAG31_NODE_27354_length_427_cov_0.942073_1_plen_94_part_01